MRPNLIETFQSPIHGTGVRARSNIMVGETLAEYTGNIISVEDWQEEVRQGTRVHTNGHTFLMRVDDDHFIDGDNDYNIAKWMNHSCEPNAFFEQDGSQVFVRASRAILRGEEVFVFYALQADKPWTKATQKRWACHCGTLSCNGSMLDPTTTRRKS